MIKLGLSSWADLIKILFQLPVPANLLALSQTFLMSTFAEVKTYEVTFLNYMMFEGLLRYYEEILRMLSQHIQT